MTFSHLSGSLRIPEAKKVSSFDAIKLSAYFRTSSNARKCTLRFALTGINDNQKGLCLGYTPGAIELPNQELATFSLQVYIKMRPSVVMKQFRRTFPLPVNGRFRSIS